jgi:hypothetical protein
MTAVIKNTAPNATAPWVLPGNYTVRLKVNDKVLEQPLLVKMDPRVKTTMNQLKRQHDLSVICYDGRKKTMKQFPEIARKFSSLFNLLDDTDMPPTQQVEKAILETQKQLQKLLSNEK